MFTSVQRRFLGSQRVARLATSDLLGVPHIVPVCFVLREDAVYIALDSKPKSVGPMALKRVSNILDNSRVSLLVDRYDEDWSFLAWMRLDGHAEVVLGGAAHGDAMRLLQGRYEQYRSVLTGDEPLIVVRVDNVVAWAASANW